MSGLTRACFLLRKKRPSKGSLRNIYVLEVFPSGLLSVCEPPGGPKLLKSRKLPSQNLGTSDQPRSWEAAEIFGRLAKHLPFLWEMAEENELRFGPRTQRWGTACMCVIYMCIYIYFQIIYIHIVITYTYIDVFTHILDILFKNIFQFAWNIISFTQIGCQIERPMRWFGQQLGSRT